MADNHPIPISTGSSTLAAGLTAPTPQNTPLNPAPIGGGLSKPTVPDIAEGDEKSDGDSDESGDEVPQDTAAAIQATMLGMVQGKLAGLVGKSSGYIEGLPHVVKRRIEGVKGVHAEFIKLETQHKQEMLALDRKFAELYKPVFERRHLIIDGAQEPTDAEIKAGEELTLKEDPEAEPFSQIKEEPGEKKDAKGIPEFWLTALRNHHTISETITERDEDALRSLTDIQLSYLQAEPGYIISFHFKHNDYFTNENLTKTYYQKKELGYEGDWVYDHGEGTQIHWKADKDLTKTVEVRKQRNKNTNRTRIVKKVKKTDSFFDFFTAPVPPTPEQIASGELEDVEGELDFRLEMDYQIAEDLKERVIPRAIDYFTGKAIEYDMQYGSGADDDDDEDDFQGFGHDDGDDDDDDDDDEIPMPKKKGGKAAVGGGKDGECKNQ